MAGGDNPGPVVFPQDNSGGGTAPTPPDYGSAGSAVPQPSGTVDIWGLPDGIGQTKIWYDTGTTPAQKVSGPGSTGEHSGGGGYNSPATDYQVNMTADQLMQQVAAMSMNRPDQYQAMQKLLAAANYYNGATQVYGTWGQTEAALARAVQDYIKVTHNQQGEGAGVPIDFRTYLQRVAQANAANGNPGNGNGSAGSPAPLSINLTDPAALQQTVESAAQAALGRGLTPEETQKFISAFQGNETAQQTQAYDSAQAGQNYTTTTPNATADAAAFVQETDPQGYVNHQGESYVNAFLNMFLPSESSRPNIAPVARA